MKYTVYKVNTHIKIINYFKILIQLFNVCWPCEFFHRNVDIRKLLVRLSYLPLIMWISVANSCVQVWYQVSTH